MASQEDAAVIEGARKVAGQCGISRFDLKTVLWVGGGHSDECSFLGRSFNTLVLPKSLIGALRPEECEPLIASAIIRSKSGERIVRRGALTRLVLPAGLIGLVLTFVALIFRTESWTWYVIEAGGAVSTPILLQFFAPESKKAFLTVDRIVAETVGTRRFLQVLQKIDGMGLKDVERLKAGGLRRRFRPSITERIDNLQLIQGTNPY